MRSSLTPPPCPQPQGTPAPATASQQPRCATTSSWCATAAHSSRAAWVAMCSGPTWSPCCSSPCPPSASASSRPSWLECAGVSSGGGGWAGTGRGLTLASLASDLPEWGPRGAAAGHRLAGVPLLPCRDRPVEHHLQRHSHGPAGPRRGPGQPDRGEGGRGLVGGLPTRPH